MVEYIICREYYYYHILIEKTVGGTDMRQEACAMCDSTSGMMLAADLTEVALEDVCKLAGVHRYFI